MKKFEVNLEAVITFGPRICCSTLPHHHLLLAFCDSFEVTHSESAIIVASWYDGYLYRRLSTLRSQCSDRRVT